MLRERKYVTTRSSSGSSPCRMRTTRLCILSSNSDCCTLLSA
jgi:hypothetical protein